MPAEVDKMVLVLVPSLSFSNKLKSAAKSSLFPNLNLALTPYHRLSFPFYRSGKKEYKKAK